MKRILLPIALIVIVISTTAFFDSGKYETYQYHDKAILPLPMGFNSLFTGSGECEACHGATGTGANPSANADAAGNDVSPVTDWRATMMANAAKDPLWRAKVSHEGLVNPAHKNELETTCTACHAPSGNKAAMHDGNIHYLISDLVQDSIGLDGVNCTGCHSMAPDNLGQVFSAQMTYDTNKIIYGQYTSPITGPMINDIGYIPMYSGHISSSELCGACHTLITSSVDTAGVPTGTDFVEQATYHEWVNSSFNTDNNPQGQSCQDCHMPSINDNVVIANRPPWLFTRSPFSKHYFVGANAFMLRILRDNNSALNLSATQTQFDTVINRTLNQLQQQTLNLSIDLLNRVNDTAYFSLYLENLAGHKFPSGYPSRRMYIDFIVFNANGDTLFHSGKHDADYRLLDENTPFEPHYNVIVADTQVQIYEMVMGDVTGARTTILEQAYTHLKDNRLTPLGFTTTHNSYDTVSIVGNALNDANFNKINGVEGSGADSLYYHVALNGYTGAIKAIATVYYQAVPPTYLDDMLGYNSQEIDLFRNLYNAADKTPDIVVQDSIMSFPVTMPELKNTYEIAVWPNPATDVLHVTAGSNLNFEIYDVKGMLVKKGKVLENKISVDDLTQGVYFVNVLTIENQPVRVQKFVKR